jgi:hypothetical protein
MQITVEDIEQVISVYWEVGKSADLRAFAEKIMRAKERRESEVAIRQSLASFQVEKFERSPNKPADDCIIAWLNKCAVMHTGSKGKTRPDVQI